MPTLQALLDTLPRPGTVDWIGVRPAREAEVTAVVRVDAKAGSGRAGDHYARPGGKRQMTLIQAEQSGRL